MTIGKKPTGYQDPCTLSDEPIRLAVLTNTVPDYRFPVLADIASNDDFSTQIFISLPKELACQEARTHLSLHYSRGFNLPFRTKHRATGTIQLEALHIPWKLAIDLWRMRANVIITGEFGLRSFVALIIGRLQRVPVLCWTEETLIHAQGVSRAASLLRSWLLPRMQGFIAWGKPAVQFLLDFGISPSKIVHVAQSINNDWWLSQDARLNRTSVRRSLNFDKFTFLYVGQMIERKGVAHLLHAWAQLPQSAQDRSELVLVGDGPQYSELQQLAAKLNIRVRFEGKQTPTQLALYYKGSDIFVFPSLMDVWGMVVNEAMLFGLPVVGSRFAGACEELLSTPGTGMLIDPRNESQFALALEQMLAAREDTNPLVSRSLILDRDSRDTSRAIRRTLRVKLDQRHLF